MVAYYVLYAQQVITFTKKVCLDKATKVFRMSQVQPLPPTGHARVVAKLMLNLLRRRTPIGTSPTPATGDPHGVSFCRHTLRNINWKLIVFCVALWWFIYSAPTEGILSPQFWAASTATNSDDF